MTWQRWRTIIVLGAVGALMLALPAGAQEDEVPISTVDTEEYPEVTVEFSAPPSMSGGQLTPEEIALTEDGLPREFSVRQTTAQNIELVLAIDTSGSMLGAPIEQAIVAAQGLVEQLPSDSRIALVGFGNEPVVLAAFTSDTTVIVEAISNIAVDPVAETSLYDATRVAIQQFTPTASGPRYVVIVTDGGDTISEGSLGEAQAAVQAAEIPVFAVSLVTSESDPLALDALSAETGGSVIEASDPQGLATLTEQVGSAIAAQYEITYTSESNGPTVIEITLSRGEETSTGSVGVELPRIVEVAPTVTPVPTEAPVLAAPPMRPAPVPVFTNSANLSWLLPVGVLLLAIAMVVLFSYLLWPTRRRRKPLRDMAPLAGEVARNSGSLLTSGSEALVRAAERIVAHRDGEGRLARRIDRAGIRVRPAEFIVMTGLASVVAGLLGLLVNPGFALMLALLVVVGAWTLLVIRGSKRAAKFEEQLPMTLRVMSGGLRGGFSLSQVVEMVAHESNSPTADEFARLSLEENLGRDITESFRDIGDRMNSEDFEWVAEAVEINRSVGGDLAEVLENVSDTIRTRHKVKGQIQTLSAEGRLSASILLAIPFFTFAAQMVVDPALAAELYETGAGRVSIVLGLTLMTIATIWMRRIVRLKY